MICRQIVGIRISSGLFRGRQIKLPRGGIARPTGARTRESMFSIIQSYIQDAVFYDFYAGSGIMSLEALSRGAQTAVAVENDRRYAIALKKLAGEWNLSGLQVRNTTVETFAGKTTGLADVLYADPPFTEAYPDISPWFELIREGGVLICEFPARQQPDFPREPDRISRYGESSLAFFYI